MLPYISRKSTRLRSMLDSFQENHSHSSPFRRSDPLGVWIVWICSNQGKEYPRYNHRHLHWAIWWKAILHRRKQHSRIYRRSRRLSGRMAHLRLHRRPAGKALTIPFPPSSEPMARSKGKIARKVANRKVPKSLIFPAFFGHFFERKLPKKLPENPRSTRNAGSMSESCRIRTKT